MLENIRTQLERLGRNINLLRINTQTRIVDGFRYFYDNPSFDLRKAGLRRKGLIQRVCDEPYIYIIKPLIQPLIDLYYDEQVRLVISNVITIVVDIANDTKTIFIKYPRYLLNKIFINVARKFTGTNIVFHESVSKPKFICYNKLKLKISSFIKPPMSMERFALLARKLRVEKKKPSPYTTSCMNIEDPRSEKEKFNESIELEQMKKKNMLLCNNSFFNHNPFKKHPLRKQTNPKLTGNYDIDSAFHIKTITTINGVFLRYNDSNFTQYHTDKIHTNLSTKTNLTENYKNEELMSQYLSIVEDCETEKDFFNFQKETFSILESLVSYSEPEPEQDPVEVSQDHEYELEPLATKQHYNDFDFTKKKLNLIHTQIKQIDDLIIKSYLTECRYNFIYNKKVQYLLDREAEQNSSTNLFKNLKKYNTFGINIEEELSHLGQIYEIESKIHKGNSDMINAVCNAKVAHKKLSEINDNIDIRNIFEFNKDISGLINEIETRRKSDPEFEKELYNAINLHCSNEGSEVSHSTSKLLYKTFRNAVIDTQENTQLAFEYTKTEIDRAHEIIKNSENIINERFNNLPNLLISLKNFEESPVQKDLVNDMHEMVAVKESLVLHENPLESNDIKMDDSGVNCLIKVDLIRQKQAKMKLTIEDSKNILKNRKERLIDLAVHENFKNKNFYKEPIFKDDSELDNEYKYIKNEISNENIIIHNNDLILENIDLRNLGLLSREERTNSVIENESQSLDEILDETLDETLDVSSSNRDETILEISSEGVPTRKGKPIFAQDGNVIKKVPSLKSIDPLKTEVFVNPITRLKNAAESTNKPQTLKLVEGIDSVFPFPVVQAITTTLVQYSLTHNPLLFVPTFVFFNKFSGKNDKPSSIYEYNKKIKYDNLNLQSNDLNDINKNKNIKLNLKINSPKITLELNDTNNNKFKSFNNKDLINKFLKKKNLYINLKDNNINRNISFKDYQPNICKMLDSVEEKNEFTDEDIELCESIVPNKIFKLIDEVSAQINEDTPKMYPGYIPITKDNPQFNMFISTHRENRNNFDFIPLYIEHPQPSLGGKFRDTVYYKDELNAIKENNKKLKELDSDSKSESNSFKLKYDAIKMFAETESKLSKIKKNLQSKETYKYAYRLHENQFENTKQTILNHKIYLDKSLYSGGGHLNVDEYSNLIKDYNYTYHRLKIIQKLQLGYIEEMDNIFCDFHFSPIQSLITLNNTHSYKIVDFPHISLDDYTFEKLNNSDQRNILDNIPVLSTETNINSKIFELDRDQEVLNFDINQLNRQLPQLPFYYSQRYIDIMRQVERTPHRDSIREIYYRAAQQLEMQQSRTSQEEIEFFSYDQDYWSETDMENFGPPLRLNSSYEEMQSIVDLFKKYSTEYFLNKSLNLNDLSKSIYDFLLRDKEQNDIAEEEAEFELTNDIFDLIEEIFYLFNRTISFFELPHKKKPTPHFNEFSNFILDIVTSKYRKNPLNNEIFDLLQKIYPLLNNNNNSEFIDILKNIRKFIITDLNKLYITKQNSDIKQFFNILKTYNNKNFEDKFVQCYELKVESEKTKQEKISNSRSSTITKGSDIGQGKIYNSRSSTITKGSGIGQGKIYNSRTNVAAMKDDGNIKPEISLLPGLNVLDANTLFRNFFKNSEKVAEEDKNLRISLESELSNLILLFQMFNETLDKCLSKNKVDIKLYLSKIDTNLINFNVDFNSLSNTFRMLILQAINSIAMDFKILNERIAITNHIKEELNPTLNTALGLIQNISSLKTLRDNSEEQRKFIVQNILMTEDMKRNQRLAAAGDEIAKKSLDRIQTMLKGYSEKIIFCGQQIDDTKNILLELYMTSLKSFKDPLFRIRNLENLFAANQNNRQEILNSVEKFYVSINNKIFKDLDFRFNFKENRELTVDELEQFNNLIERITSDARYSLEFDATDLYLAVKKVAAETFRESFIANFTNQKTHLPKLKNKKSEIFSGKFILKNKFSRLQRELIQEQHAQKLSDIMMDFIKKNITQFEDNLIKFAHPKMFVDRVRTEKDFISFIIQFGFQLMKNNQTNVSLNNPQKHLSNFSLIFKDLQEEEIAGGLFLEKAKKKIMGYIESEFELAEKNIIHKYMHESLHRIIIDFANKGKVFSLSYSEVVTQYKLGATIIFFGHLLRVAYESLQHIQGCTQHVINGLKIEIEIEELNFKLLSDRQDSLTIIFDNFLRDNIEDNLLEFIYSIVDDSKTYVDPFVINKKIFDTLINSFLAFKTVIYENMRDKGINLSVNQFKFSLFKYFDTAIDDIYTRLDLALYDINKQFTTYSNNFNITSTYLGLLAKKGICQKITKDYSQYKKAVDAINQVYLNKGFEHSLRNVVDRIIVVDEFSNYLKTSRDFEVVHVKDRKPFPESSLIQGLTSIENNYNKDPLIEINENDLLIEASNDNNHIFNFNQDFVEINEKNISNFFFKNYNYGFKPTLTNPFLYDISLLTFKLNLEKALKQSHYTQSINLSKDLKTKNEIIYLIETLLVNNQINSDILKNNKKLSYILKNFFIRFKTNIDYSTNITENIKDKFNLLLLYINNKEDKGGPVINKNIVKALSEKVENICIPEKPQKISKEVLMEALFSEDLIHEGDVDPLDLLDYIEPENHEDLICARKEFFKPIEEKLLKKPINPFESIIKLDKTFHSNLVKDFMIKLNIPSHFYDSILKVVMLMSKENILAQNLFHLDQKGFINFIEKSTFSIDLLGDRKELINDFIQSSYMQQHFSNQINNYVYKHNYLKKPLFPTIFNPHFSSNPTIQNFISQQKFVKFSHILKNPYYDIDQLKIFLALQQNNNILEFPRLFFNEIEEIFNAVYPGETSFNLFESAKLNNVESFIHLGNTRLTSILEGLKEIHTLFDNKLNLNFRLKKAHNLILSGKISSTSERDFLLQIYIKLLTEQMGDQNMLIWLIEEDYIKNLYNKLKLFLYHGSLSELPKTNTYINEKTILNFNKLQGSILTRYNKSFNADLLNQVNQLKTAPLPWFGNYNDELPWFHDSNYQLVTNIPFKKTEKSLINFYDQLDCPFDNKSNVIRDLIDIYNIYKFLQNIKIKYLGIDNHNGDSILKDIYNIFSFIKYNNFVDFNNIFIKFKFNKNIIKNFFLDIKRGFMATQISKNIEQPSKSLTKIIIQDSNKKQHQIKRVLTTIKPFLDIKGYNKLDLKWNNSRISKNIIFLDKQNKKSIKKQFNEFRIKNNKFEDMTAKPYILKNLSEKFLLNQNFNKLFNLTKDNIVNFNFIRPLISTPNHLINKKIWMVQDFLNDLKVEAQAMLKMDPECFNNESLYFKLLTTLLPKKKKTINDLFNIPITKLSGPTDLLNHDNFIFNLLNFQKIEPQIQLNLFYVVDGVILNGFKKYIRDYKILNKSNILLSKLTKIEDKYPFLNSPLKHLGAHIVLRVNNSIHYTFRFLGLKGNLTQTTIFSDNSYISFFHILKLKQTLFDSRGLFLIPKYLKKTDLKANKTLLVRNKTQCFFIKEYKSYQTNKLNHEIYIITGDNKPVQVFTKLSSYKEMLNPELRSLLQFDFGYFKLEDMPYKTSMNSKFVLNINYKVHVDKSFSTAPKVGLYFHFNKLINKNNNLIFAHLMKPYNSNDFFSNLITTYLRRQIRYNLFDKFKMNELQYNKFNLKYFFLGQEKNTLNYQKQSVKSLLPQWISAFNGSEFMKLTAKYIYMYRNKEFVKNVNKQVYSMLKRYNTVDKIYAAPYKHHNPLNPATFASNYRYILFSKLNYPGASRAYLPKFLFEDKESRLIKIFANLNIFRRRLKSQLEYFIYFREFKSINKTHDRITLKKKIKKPSFGKYLTFNSKEYSLRESNKECLDTLIKQNNHENKQNHLSKDFKNPTVLTSSTSIFESNKFLNKIFDKNFDLINNFKILILNQIKRIFLNILNLGLILDLKSIEMDLRRFQNIIYLIILKYNPTKDKVGHYVEMLDFYLFSKPNIDKKEKKKKEYNKFFNVLSSYRNQIKEKEKGKEKEPDLTPEDYETTRIVDGFNTLLPYFHNNFSSIFTQYFWSYAWRAEFKYLVHTTPIELLTYYKGHFIHLPNDTQYKDLFEKLRKGNQFLYLIAHSFKDYKQFVELNKYLQNSVKYLFNFTLTSENLINFRIFSLKKNRSKIIFMSIQNEKILNSLIAPNFTSCKKFVPRYLRLTPCSHEVTSPVWGGFDMIPDESPQPKPKFRLFKAETEAQSKYKYKTNKIKREKMPEPWTKSSLSINNNPIEFFKYKNDFFIGQYDEYDTFKMYIDLLKKKNVNPTSVNFIFKKWKTSDLLNRKTPVGFFYKSDLASFPIIIKSDDEIVPKLGKEGKKVMEKLEKKNYHKQALKDYYIQQTLKSKQQAIEDPYQKARNKLKLKQILEKIKSQSNKNKKNNNNNKFIKQLKLKVKLKKNELESKAEGRGIFNKEIQFTEDKNLKPIIRQLNFKIKRFKFQETLFGLDKKKLEFKSVEIEKHPNYLKGLLEPKLVKGTPINYLDDFATLKNSDVILNSLCGVGIDWKLINSFKKMHPDFFKPLVQISSNVEENIETLDQTEQSKVPTIEQKGFKLITTKQKTLNMLNKGILAEFYETINDIIKSEFFSWITFHEYREQLLRNQTEIFPGGIISQVLVSFIQGSIFTYMLYATDYRRAPNKKSAARLVSWKFLMIFGISSAISFVSIHYGGVDLFGELIENCDEFFFEPRIPQLVLKPEFSYTLDQYNNNIYKTPQCAQPEDFSTIREEIYSSEKTDYFEILAEKQKDKPLS